MEQYTQREETTVSNTTSRRGPSGAILLLVVLLLLALLFYFTFLNPANNDQSSAPADTAPEQITPTPTTAFSPTEVPVGTGSAQ